MFLLLLAFWFIFNGRFTVEILIFGLVISLVICIFMNKFMDYSFKQELKMIPILPDLLVYIVILVVEIIKANFGMLKYIRKGPDRINPAIITFKVEFKTDLARTLLANSITLTPGTITVKCKDNDFYVHCLDKSLAEGIDTSIFVRRLKKMEAKL